MRTFFVAALVGAGPALAVAQSVAAPTGRCTFDLERTPTTSLNTIQLPSGKYNSFFGGGVRARCRQQNMVLNSDSLEHYGDEGRFYFVGHVDYKEPRLKLKADYLTYFQREERVLAFINVDAQLPSGSTLKGSSLEYFRALPNVRRGQRAIAVGRPTMNIVEKDPQGKPQPPVTVTGNSIWLEGDTVVASSGEVVVVRPELLTATGDSLYLNNTAGLLRIMRKPRILGTKGRPFTLVGETIDVFTRRRKVERVVSKNGAEAVSEDLKLQSDTIDLRVSDDLLQRAIAWGKSRARATSPTQVISSDSIDVLMPRQRIREMHAVRGASAEGSPDTTKFKTKEKDRLTGDTIVAQFDSIPAADTVTKPQVKQLLAIGHATSLQHLAPRDTACRLPAINYVRGRTIAVTFDSTKKVKQVEVKEKDQEQSGGLYLEPNPECTASAPLGAAAPATTAQPTPPASTTTTPGSTPPSPAPARPTPTPTPTAPPPRRP